MDSLAVRVAVGTYVGTAFIWWLLYKSSLATSFSALGPVTDPGSPITGSVMAAMGAFIGIYLLQYGGF